MGDVVPHELRVLFDGNQQVVEETLLIASMLPNNAGVRTAAAVVACACSAVHRSRYFAGDQVTIETSPDRLWPVGAYLVLPLARRVVREAFDYMVEPTAEVIDLADQIAHVFVSTFKSPMVLANFKPDGRVGSSIIGIGHLSANDPSTMSSLLIFGDEQRVGVLLHRSYE